MANIADLKGINFKLTWATDRKLIQIIRLLQTFAHADGLETTSRVLDKVPTYLVAIKFLEVREFPGLQNLPA